MRSGCGADFALKALSNAEIRKILVANRSEIAIRDSRAVTELEIDFAELRTESMMVDRLFETTMTKHGAYMTEKDGDLLRLCAACSLSSSDINVEFGHYQSK